MLKTCRAAGALSKGDRSCGRKIWLCPARATRDWLGCLGSSSAKLRPARPPKVGMWGISLDRRIDSTEPNCSQVAAHDHLGAVNWRATRDLWVRLIQHFEFQSDLIRPLMCLKDCGAYQRSEPLVLVVLEPRIDQISSIPPLTRA